MFFLSVCVMRVGLLPFCSLRPLDVEFMKALHEKVNIVPVLAKADTLTPSEVKKKKIKASSRTLSCTVLVWLELYLLVLY